MEQKQCEKKNEGEPMQESSHETPDIRALWLKKNPGNIQVQVGSSVLSTSNLPILPYAYHKHPCYSNSRRLLKAPLLRR